MKTKNFFAIKLATVTLMLGLFSPSISIQNVETPTQNISTLLLSSEISFKLTKQAEARRHKRRGYNKSRRKAVRRGHRRANYRHHRRSNKRRNNVVGAVIGGAILGAALNNNRSRRHYY